MLYTRTRAYTLAISAVRVIIDPGLIASELLADEGTTSSAF